MRALERKNEELHKIAEENIERGLAKVRDRRNLWKLEADLRKGDEVMFKRNRVQDSLSPRYDGPFEVLERSGPDVKLKLETKDRWVHLDNVKRYSGSGHATVPEGNGNIPADGSEWVTIAPYLGSDVTEDDPVTPVPAAEYDATEGYPDNTSDASQIGLEEEANPTVGKRSGELDKEQRRRYPSRDRRPPKRWDDYSMGGTSSGKGQPHHL